MKGPAIGDNSVSDMEEDQETREHVSEFVIYLKVEPYLAQWLHSHYGDPVVFPKNSTENDIIELGLVTKKIAENEKETPDLPEEGKIAISLPYYKFTEVRSRFHLLKKSKESLLFCIKARFALELWTELFKFRNRNEMKQEIIWVWMEKHGIDMTESNWNVIAKIYRRKMDVYRKDRWRKKQKNPPK